MNIGIIGSGGREHSICKSLLKSNKIKKLFCFPGNGGTSEIATNVPLDLTNFEEIKNFIFKKKIDLVIVGPEKPLVDGIVDYLEKFNIKVFGPNSDASKLEGSKIFTKQICKEYNIPTANFGIFKNKIDAKKFTENSKYPLVIKADNKILSHSVGMNIVAGNPVIIYEKKMKIIPTGLADIVDILLDQILLN